MPSSNHRFIYNCDGNNTFINDKYPMDTDQLLGYVDEIAKTGVTTFMKSCHIGMDFNFDGNLCELVGTHMNTGQNARLDDPDIAELGTAEIGLKNMRHLIDEGHDPLDLTIERSQELGMETFITFRMNEVHNVEQADSWLLSRFWSDHPEWHVGTPGDELPDLHTEILGPVSPIVNSWIPGGLNFFIPEVRTHILGQLKEICERYPIDGLDLDFQRFPIYIPFGEEQKGMQLMTFFIHQVRAMTNDIADDRERPLLLSARVMARPEQNLGLGLDVPAWTRAGLLDFVTVSHYLKNSFPLPISEYRKTLPAELPVYASVEYETDKKAYQNIARPLWKDGVDGLMMFNFFAGREGTKRPPFGVFKSIKEPEKVSE
jgi:hypothetical protein